MIRRLLPIAPLVLASCAYDGRPEAPPAPELAQCNADAVQGLVGKLRGAKVEARALKHSGARTVRWIAPGDMVTMDYRLDRLNLETDEQGRITAARCG